MAIYLSFKETNDADGTHLALEKNTFSHFYWFNLCYRSTRLSKAHFWMLEGLNISQWKHAACSTPWLCLISFASMFGSCHLEWLDWALCVLFTTENKVQHNTDQQSNDAEFYCTLCFPPAVVLLHWFLCEFFSHCIHWISFLAPGVRPEGTQNQSSTGSPLRANLSQTPPERWCIITELWTSSSAPWRTQAPSPASPPTLLVKLTIR